jgi:hypothetical protein
MIVMIAQICAGCPVKITIHKNKYKKYKRPGSEKDVERLIKTFSSLGIHLFENVNYEKNKMEATSQMLKCDDDVIVKTPGTSQLILYFIYFIF